MPSDWLSKGYVVLSEPVRHKGKPVAVQEEVFREGLCSPKKETQRHSTHSSCGLCLSAWYCHVILLSSSRTGQHQRWLSGRMESS